MTVQILPCYRSIVPDLDLAQIRQSTSASTERARAQAQSCDPEMSEERGPYHGRGGRLLHRRLDLPRRRRHGPQDLARHPREPGHCLHTCTQRWRSDPSRRFQNDSDRIFGRILRALAKSKSLAPQQANDRWPLATYGLRRVPGRRRRRGAGSGRGPRRRPPTARPDTQHPKDSNSKLSSSGQFDRMMAHQLDEDRVAVSSSCRITAPHVHPSIKWWIACSHRIVLDLRRQRHPTTRTQ